MTKFHAFSSNLASTDTTKSEYFVNKNAEPEPVEQFPMKPSKTLQLGKRHQRASSVSSTIQDAGQYPTKSRRASTGVLKQPPSPTVATNRSGAGPASTDQLRECLEAYFAACLEDGVEDYADTNLFQLLVPPAISLRPQEPLKETTLESSLPLPGRDLAQLTSSQSTVPLHTIIRSRS
ncbi:hypothetical protein FRC05_005130 [Tulasnella sp. 425]|nr:hypothetical protein FRC05_005130 [Tulasnella sp. 425]